MTAFIRLTPVAPEAVGLGIDGAVDLVTGAGGVEAAAGDIAEGGIAAATGGAVEAATGAVEEATGAEAAAGGGEAGGGEGDGEEGGGLIECAQAVVSGAVEDAAKEPLDDKDRVNGEKIGEAAVTGGAIEGVRECT
jgi:hypothetical protein